ncbi:MAG TPA: DUF2344 domain-containing protein [Clostridium sp.]|jgi:radical SAM-linked protein|nr:DUF2344 domain-containing protein [Clostridium sp.]
MSSIRTKFIRGEEVKFISHLDLMKVFERALRRSGIPILYSKGFNPHPQLVFGLPLSVGVTSESEYLDLELEEPINVHEFMDKLNNCLPKGIRLIDAKEKKTKENIMASVVAASYEILVTLAKFNLNEAKDLMDRFMKLEEIVVKKQTKRKIKDVDIRPMIYSVDIKTIDTKAFICKTNKQSENNIFCFSALLSAGSSANLKPVLLIEALNNIFDTDFDIIKIHRTGLFIGSRDKLLNPLD